MHAPHRRDLGLRRVAVFTRRVAVGSVALTGLFTALVARPHASSAQTTDTPSTRPTTRGSAAPPVTLPPDTFAPETSAPNAGAAPSTAAPAPATAPQPPPTPPQTSAAPAPVTSGAS
jgi:hypothetical protein